VDTLDQAVKALNSDDEEIRLQGLRALAAGEPEIILAPLFQAFGDASWRVRKEAIEIYLGLAVSQELIGEIIELLHAEENAGLRNAAVELLVRLDRDAVPMLLENMDCPDHDVRKFIVDILGEIGDRQAIPALVGALQDPDNNVLAAAAENLGKLQAAEAIPALLEAMRNPDVLLRFTILEALGQIKQPVPIVHLEPYRNEKLLRKALIDCLGRVGDPSTIAEVITALSDPMQNVRKAALLALMNMAERYPDQVRGQLANHDLSSTVDAVRLFLGEDHAPDLRAAAVRVLGWLGAAGAVKPLLELLDTEPLQPLALAALADIGSEKPEELVAAWQDIPEFRRPYLAYVLGEARIEAALPRLREALAASDAQLRRTAAHALGRVASAEAIADLVQCLADEDESVRSTASQSLTGLGGLFPMDAFEQLKKPLEKGDSAARMFAVAALANIDHPEVPTKLGVAIKDPDPQVRRAATKAFNGRVDQEHVGNLLLVLNDEDSQVRRTAVEILATSDLPEVLDGLALGLEDEDIWVRAAAVRAYGQRGGRTAAQRIAGVVGDPVGLVSIAALETLYEILNEEACPLLVGALDHADEEVVSAALNLLSRCHSTDWFPAHAEELINHPFWAVRTHFARFAANLLGEEARPLLERRLAVEGEDLVRQQLLDSLQLLSRSED